MLTFFNGILIVGICTFIVALPGLIGYAIGKLISKDNNYTNDTYNTSEALRQLDRDIQRTNELIGQDIRNKLSGRYSMGIKHNDKK